MPMKPAGKWTLVVILAVGSFFLLMPLLSKKKKTSVPTETVKDSVISNPSKAVPVPKLETKPVAEPMKPVQKKVVKPVVPKEQPKKKGKERENLNINI